MVQLVPHTAPHVVLPTPALPCPSPVGPCSCSPGSGTVPGLRPGMSPARDPHGAAPGCRAGAVGCSSRREQCWTLTAPGRCCEPTHSHTHLQAYPHAPMCRYMYLQLYLHADIPTWSYACVYIYLDAAIPTCTYTYVKLYRGADIPMCSHTYI